MVTVMLVGECFNKNESIMQLTYARRIHVDFSNNICTTLLRLEGCTKYSSVSRVYSERMPEQATTRQSICVIH